MLTLQVSLFVSTAFLMLLTPSQSNEYCSSTTCENLQTTDDLIADQLNQQQIDIHQLKLDVAELKLKLSPKTRKFENHDRTQKQLTDNQFS